jgi:hypothetical protein
MRVSTAERRAIINTRIASTFPSRVLGDPVADPERAARAAANASTGSDLPCRWRVWRLGLSTSTTVTPSRWRYLETPTPYEPVPSTPTSTSSPWERSHETNWG